MHEGTKQGWGEEESSGKQEVSPGAVEETGMKEERQEWQRQVEYAFSSILITALGTLVQVAGLHLVPSCGSWGTCESVQRGSLLCSGHIRLFQI